MPNIKSVKKDVLRSRARRLRNQAVKSRIKTFVKKANALMSSGEVTEVHARDDFANRECG